MTKQWLITNGTKYYQGIERQKGGLMKDEIKMGNKRKAKTFSDQGKATATAKRLGIRFNINLKARRG